MKQYLRRFMKDVEKFPFTCGQSYKGSTIVNYDSRVVPDWKKPHTMTLKL